MKQKTVKAWAILDKQFGFMEAAHSKNAAECAIKYIEDHGTYGRYIVRCSVTFDDKKI